MLSLQDALPSRDSAQFVTNAMMTIPPVGRFNTQNARERGALFEFVPTALGTNYSELVQHILGTSERDKSKHRRRAARGTNNGANPCNTAGRFRRSIARGYSMLREQTTVRTLATQLGAFADQPPVVIPCFKQKVDSCEHSHQHNMGACSP